MLIIFPKMVHDGLRERNGTPWWCWSDNFKMQNAMQTHGLWNAILTGSGWI